MERLITMLILLLFSGCSALGFFGSDDEAFIPDNTSGTPPAAEFDASLFIERAEGAACADRLNAMYLIDSEYVIWYRQGDCADNSYGTTLYDALTGNALCSAYDSIAGPVTDCNDESNLEFFQVLSSNSRPDALEGYVVEEIYSAGGGIRGRQ